MEGIENVWAFVVATILLCLAPGQDNIVIATRSAAQGVRSGLWTVAGIMSGNTIHIILAAFGLSAILATSALAFSIVKIAGAIYLVYLGVQMLFDKSSNTRSTEEQSDRLPGARLYWQGFLTNLLNPKVVIFFLAFFPQFVSPETTSQTQSFLMLGVIFNVIALTWCASLAVATATLASVMGEALASATWLKRLSGAVFVGLGIKLATERQ